MKIWVSSVARAPEIAKVEKPSHAVSLMSPGDWFPELGLGDLRHHKIHLHDIREELLDHVAPNGEHVRGLIGFLEEWPREDPLLVHCWAGISRSTATAYVAACLHNPQADEIEIAQALRAASPTAFPNTRIVDFADDILGRKGRMRKAIDSMGRGEVAEEAVPFFIPARFGSGGDKRGAQKDMGDRS